MTPQELEILKVNCRIVAVESMLAAILSATARTQEGKASLLSMIDHFPKSVENMALPGMSPEWADLYASEQQDAIQGLCDFLKSHLRR